jgi:tetratricopeptide (TPR) repeat protein
MYYTQGELVETCVAARRVRELGRSIGEAGMVAVAENLLGHAELGAGNVDAARDQFTRSLRAFQSVRIPWGIGNSLSGLAAVALQTGDSARAERLIEEAVSTLRHGGPLYLALALYVRASLAVRRGRPDEALAVVQESLRHIRELQDKFAFVYALIPLAAAAVLKGDDEWAARILGARDAATERTGATVVDRSLDDRTDLSESGVRARLGPRRWALAYTAGRSASIDALLEDIEAVVASPHPVA